MAMAAPLWRPGGAFLRWCAALRLEFACRVGPRPWSGSAPQVALHYFLTYLLMGFNGIIGLVPVFGVLLYLDVGWAGGAGPPAALGG